MTGQSTRGQSSVEFALILPLVLVLVLALAQVGLIVQAQISVTHAAREGVRALAVDPAANAQGVVLDASNLAEAQTTVDVAFDSALVGGRQLVEVTVTYRVPQVSSLLQPLVGDTSVSATATMLVEG